MICLMMFFVHTSRIGTRTGTRNKEVEREENRMRARKASRGRGGQDEGKEHFKSIRRKG